MGTAKVVRSPPTAIRKALFEQGSGEARNVDLVLRNASVVAGANSAVKLMTLSGKDFVELVLGNSAAFDVLKESLGRAHDSRERQTAALRVWRRSEAHERLEARRASHAVAGRSLFDD